SAPGLNPKIAQNLRVSYLHLAAVHPPNYAFARQRIKSIKLAEFDASACRSLNDCGPYGMFASALDAGRKFKDFEFAPMTQRNHSSEPGLAFGERASLIDPQRIDLFHQFEHFGVLNQNAGSRSTTGSHHD